MKEGEIKKLPVSQLLTANLCEEVRGTKPTKTGYVMLSIAVLVDSIVLAILVWSQFLG